MYSVDNIVLRRFFIHTQKLIWGYVLKKRPCCPPPQPNLVAACLQVIHIQTLFN